MFSLAGDSSLIASVSSTRCPVSAPLCFAYVKHCSLLRRVREDVECVREHCTCLLPLDLLYEIQPVHRLLRNRTVKRSHACQRTALVLLTVASRQVTQSICVSHGPQSEPTKHVHCNYEGTRRTHDNVAGIALKWRVDNARSRSAAPRSALITSKLSGGEQTSDVIGSLRHDSVRWPFCASALSGSNKFHLLSALMVLRLFISADYFLLIFAATSK